MSVQKYWILFLCLSASSTVESQTCNGIPQYGACSTNSVCGCFHSATSNNSGICGFLWLTTSRLISCGPFQDICRDSDHVCVRHPRFQERPICYPLSMSTQQICPLTTTSTPPPTPGDGICATATWAKNGTTIVGGNGFGLELNQLNSPYGLFLDDNQSMYIADWGNHRIVKWDHGVSSGQIVAGGKGSGYHDDQLANPLDVVVDKNGTIYISDTRNHRVQQWRRNAQSGQTIIGNISVYGLALDDQESLYVSDWKNSTVTKWRLDETIESLITANLSYPEFLFVDRHRSVYIADSNNHRVIKVDDESTQISIVAGGSQGSDAHQLSRPNSVCVDALGTVYVADTHNHRIMRWLRGATSGTVIAGGQERGFRSDQLHSPEDLTFDRDGNLYVVDRDNDRVQKFDIDKSSC